jgi:preprotein translocase subunit SecB
MKPNPSPLAIVDFAITRMDFRISSPDDDTDISELFSRYDIDIDFGVRKDETIQVWVRAKINADEELKGYSIDAEAGCFFSFDDNSNLPAQNRETLEGFSAIYIGLNSLRGLISSFTANAPFGRYILPSLDLNELIEQKKKQQQEKTVKKKLVKKK